LKQDISSLELVPAGGGVFEVSVDDELVYSKKQTGEFPDFKAVLKDVRRRL